MYKKRCYVSAAYLDGSIYACGGLDGHVRLKCAEKYEISQNAWTPIPDMIQSRSDASCTSYNGKKHILTTHVYKALLIQLMEKR